MAWSKIIEPFIRPVSDVVKEVVKDKDLALRLEHDIVMAMLAQESSVMSAAAQNIQAEAKGESWLQRNWRPILMIWFAVLLGLFWFGFAPDYLIESPSTVEDLFQLLKLGIGGYIVGRSGEKITKTIAQSGGLKNVIG